MWMITATLFLIIIGLWLIWRKKNFSTFQELCIPGPKPNIFFGNLWEMMQSSPIECHEKWIKQYGKVVGYYFGFRPILVVADVDLAKQILIKDFNKFPNRAQIYGCHFKSKKEEMSSSQLAIARNKRWKEIRSIITPSFTTSKLKMMSQIMSTAIDSLMEVIDKKSKTGKSFEIYELYKRLTLDVIGRTAFGIQTDVQNNPDDIVLNAVKLLFDGSFHSIYAMLTLSFPEFEGFRKIINTIRLTIKGQGRNPMREMAQHARSIIDFRRSSDKNRRQDLLQIMMDAELSDLKAVTNEDLTAKDIEKEDLESLKKEGNGSTRTAFRMTDSEILENSILFLMAGYETTSTALAFVTHFIIHHPDVQQKLRKEIHEVTQKEGKLDYNSVQQMKYLGQVIMEALRICPPVYLLVNREVEDNVQYGPYKIKTDMTIQIPVYYMNHDPEIWENPEEFDPERFSPENKSKTNAIAFQTFGVGPRNCVGMRFALLEIKLALASILNNYELLRVKESEKDPLPLLFRQGVLAPAKGIILKAIPT